MMLMAIDQKWDVLLEMQPQQDQMLKDLFKVEGVSFSEQEKLDLIEVQRLNKEVLQAADSHKADIASELRVMRQGKAKANAYLSL
jgi:hypothetical protein